MCLVGKLCSCWNRQWNRHRLRAWDSDLVPFLHLWPWPQKVPAADIVQPESPEPGQWRNQPAGDRYCYSESVGVNPRFTALVLEYVRNFVYIMIFFAKKPLYTQNFLHILYCSGSLQASLLLQIEKHLVLTEKFCKAKL
jgi:hypothetical protein